MSHQVLKLRDLPSGQALKNFRRRLASVGTRPADAMLTTKFKLDLPAGCPLREDAATFDKCRKLYDVVEGCLHRRHHRNLHNHGRRSRNVRTFRNQR